MNLIQLPHHMPHMPLWIPRALPHPLRRARVVSAPLPAPPFAALQRKRVLFVVDDDNLRISSQRLLRCQLDYRALAIALHRVSLSCHKHAFFSSAPGDTTREVYFHRLGYQTTGLRRMSSPDGRTLNTNADFDLCVEAGFLLSLHHYQAVVVGSGDGDLALAVARGVGRLLSGIRVYTLSVPGATSERILNHPLIAANFTVPEEMLSPLAKAYRRSAQTQTKGGNRVFA